MVPTTLLAVGVVIALSCLDICYSSPLLEPISLFKEQKYSSGLGDNLFSFCNTSLTPLIINKLEIQPDEIEKGGNLQVTVSADLTENIDSGKVEVRLKEGIIPVNLNFDLCEEAKSAGYQCPLAAKPYAISQSITVPKIIPRGTVTGTVKVTDQDNVEIACINVHAKIV